VDGSVTDDQAHAWLQDIADNGWISLHFDNPGLGGAERAEISGGGYQRFKMSFSQPSNRTIWSLKDAKWTGLIQNKITYLGIWNTRDNKPNTFLRAYGELPDPVAILNGKGFIIPAGRIAVSIG
jgi:hypothetical protein